MYSMINSFSMVILDVDRDTHNVIVNLTWIILTHTFCSFFRLLLPQMVIYLLFFWQKQTKYSFRENQVFESCIACNDSICCVILYRYLSKLTP